MKILARVVVVGGFVAALIAVLIEQVVLGTGLGVVRAEANYAFVIQTLLVLVGFGLCLVGSDEALKSAAICAGLAFVLALAGALFAGDAWLVLLFATPALVLAATAGITWILYAAVDVGNPQPRTTQPSKPEPGQA